MMLVVLGKESRAVEVIDSHTDNMRLVRIRSEIRKIQDPEIKALLMAAYHECLDFVFLRE